MASDIDAFEIVVMSAYKEQAKYLITLRGLPTTSNNEARITVEIEIIRRLGKVRFSTVDAFQGSECILIITTMCRSKTVGHTEDLRRLNVTISRAKCGLIMICNNNCMTKEHGTWISVLIYLGGWTVY